MDKIVLGPKPTPVADLKQWNNNLRLMENEDVLNLEFFPLTPQQAEPEIGLSQARLMVGIKVPAEKIAEIPKAAFDDMFIRASNLRIGNESYITGLKIHLGLNGDNVFPVFQPVFLMRTTDQPGNNDYDEKGELHYIFDGNKFVEADKPDFDKILDYRKKILILHNGEQNHSNFKLGDTEGVIFPFQTIYTLLYDNRTDSTVYFYNAFRNDSGVLNQCILLSTKPKSSAKDVFENSYANRSHLCPPCTAVYEVYLRKP